MPKYVISGASSGVGFALARTLRLMGCEVIGYGRRKELVKPKGIITPDFDYRSLDYTEPYVFPIEKWVDDIDGIIHCTAMFKMATLHLHGYKEIHDMISTNLTSAIRFVQHYQPQMKNDGKIVLVSSVSGLRGQPHQTVYSATKHGLQGFADALRYEVPQKVTTICPGGINTPLWDKTEYPGNREELLTPYQVADVIIDVLQSVDMVFKNITLYPENESH
jgi:short-subunit dehydrogenase